MIAPTFHTSILKTFVPVFNKNADRLVECLKKELGAVFDVHDYMSGTTVDILLGKGSPRCRGSVVYYLNRRCCI